MSLWKALTLLAEGWKTWSPIAGEKKLFLLEAISTKYLGISLPSKKIWDKLGDVKIVSLQLLPIQLPYLMPSSVGVRQLLQRWEGGPQDLNIYNIHLVVIALWSQPQSGRSLANMGGNWYLRDTGDGLLGLSSASVSVPLEDCRGNQVYDSKATRVYVCFLAQLVAMQVINLNSMVKRGKIWIWMVSSPPMYDEFVAFEQDDIWSRLCQT